MPLSSSKIETVLIGLILFYPALVFTLPVQVFETVQFPWWANRIEIGNVLLHEILFLIWFLVFGFRYVIQRLLNGGVPTRQSAVILILLAVWCGVISLQAPLPFQDIARSLRLVLMALMMMAITRWSRNAGLYCLIALLLGFACGTIINIVISFENPFIVYGTMRLSGQNTPGVGMAVAVHLCAWYFLKAPARPHQLLAITLSLLFLFGAGISYSRTAWIISALGIFVWVYLLILGNSKGHLGVRKRSKSPKFWAPPVIVLLVLLALSPTGRYYLEWVNTLLFQKDWLESTSNTYRIGYVFGVAEIILQYPLGVGYSGFFDAMTNTKVYGSGTTSIETGLNANPHSGFLYYLSAGGIPAGILTFILFCTLLKCLRTGLVHAFGRQGYILFLAMAMSFLLIGITVPYMFNSIILIAPTAIVAGWSWHLRDLQMTQKDRIEV